MTDISKCDGNGCDFKERCWRYKSPASIYQSYIESTSCIDDEYFLFYPMPQDIRFCNGNRGELRR